MEKLSKLIIVVTIVLSFLTAPALGKKPAEHPLPNPNPGPGEFRAMPNLSFPMIATDIIDIFYRKVWVDENGDGVCDGNEWKLGYDADADDKIDNTIGEGAPIRIKVEESIVDDYKGDYPGNDGFYYQTYVVTDEGTTEDLFTQVWEDTNNDGILDWVVTDGPDGKPDLTDPILMVEWFQSMNPWYDQPVFMDATLTETVTTFDESTTAMIDSAQNPNHIWDVEYLDGNDAGGENSWQAEWRIESNNTIYIDFIDWGNPLENTVYPIVGQRFPVEIAIYEKVASTVTEDAWGVPMTGYNMGCIELPSTRDEVFGTSELTIGEFTTETAFATVITKKYFAEVENPNGTKTRISLEPGIGPSGKINFASAAGGWIPTMPGWHRIWMHFNDPLIDLSYAIVNNDEHYIMSSGFMADELNKNKLETVGVVGNSTFIDLFVQEPNGGNRPN